MGPFDAVLLVAFGGPQGPADVRPFLENVLRGRRVSPERIDEVAHHYERFGGVSPLTELTMKQGRALRRSSTSPTGTSIPASSRPTPTTSAPRSIGCLPIGAIARGWCSPRTA